MIYIGWFVRIWYSSEETGSYWQERKEGGIKTRRRTEGSKKVRLQATEIAWGEGTGEKKNKRMLSESREWCQRGEVGAKQEYLLMEEEQKANLYIARQSQANLPQGSFKFSLWSCFCMRNVQISLFERTCFFWSSLLFYVHTIKSCLAMH